MNTNAHLYYISWNGSLLHYEHLNAQTIWAMRLKSKQNLDVSETLIEYIYHRLMKDSVASNELDILMNYLTQHKDFKKASTDDFTHGIHLIMIGWNDCTGTTRVHRSIIVHPNQLTAENLSDFSISFINKLLIGSNINGLPPEFIEKWKIHSM